LFARASIESALTEYQRHMAGIRHHEADKEHDENKTAFFNSNGGPYIYDHGTLK
jgi:hypothetical protein